MTPGLNPHCLNGGSVDRDGEFWRLAIPPGSAFRYRVAQLEDYTGLSRGRFPSHPPRTLSLRARVSDGFSAGTWGFGFWNDPFGPTWNPPRLPATPNTAWFFYASPQNYLSFREDKPAQGFLAQTFRSPGFHPGLLQAALTFPFSRRATRRSLSRVIDEDGAAIHVDASQWHAYRLIWSSKQVVFEVDGKAVLETPVSPNPPLGLVIWIDNQYAAFTPEGRIGFGLLKSHMPAWLDVENIELNA